MELAAAIVGVLVGGLLTAGTTAVFERRREKRRRRMACRLLDDALRTAQADLIVSLKIGRWTGLEFDPHLDTLAPLAEGMTASEWQIVSEACSMLRVVRRTYAERANSGQELTSGERVNLDATGARAERARSVVMGQLRTPSGLTAQEMILESFPG